MKKGMKRGREGAGLKGIEGGREGGKEVESERAAAGLGDSVEADADGGDGGDHHGTQAQAQPGQQLPSRPLS